MVDFRHIYKREFFYTRHTIMVGIIFSRWSSVCPSVVRPSFRFRTITLSLALCYFVLVFFSPFSIAITSLGERANLMLFVHLFDLGLFGFICFLSSSCQGCAAACDCGTPWKYQYIFTKLGICVVIVEIWFRIANGLISSIFDSHLPAI